MNGELRCQCCGAALTGQTVGGLCASCLLKLALRSAAEDVLPLSLSAEMNPAPAALGGSTEPVRIRYFGDYELVEEIARGGMGVVYKARQASLNRVVALKMILAGDFSSPAMVERFQTEAEAAARLEHPNIVPIYEIGEHEGQHYFSMRFLEGGTLTQAMALEQFNPRRVAELMVTIARGVHHAHQRGILHRDLKPGNILFDDAGKPHVADFGLAKVLESDSTLTQSAAVMGTPSYMAPEQAEGQTKQATTAVDIYSLGAILYALLTGRPPFAGSNPLEVLTQVREREPASPQSLNAELDRDLAVICLKCLEKDPARRYGSAEALAEDLQRWQAHEPIQARRTSITERTWKWARRKPMVASLVAAVHLVALAGLAGILWQSTRAKEEAERATLEAKRANVEAGNARQESSRAESELWNAHFNEARALRIAGGSGARLKSSALLQKLIQRPGLTEPQLLGLREEAIAQMALVDIPMPTNWIPKPSWVPLAWNATLDHYVRDTGSNQVELCEFPSERVMASFFGPPKATFHGAVFSANNQFLAVRFSNARGEVRVWKLDTFEQVLQTLGSEHIGTTPESLRISPDSRTLLTLTAQGLALQPIEVNSLPRSLQRGRHVLRAEFSPDSKQIAVLPDTRDTVEIWDAESGEIQCSFTMDFNPEEVAWHPAGSHLLLGGDRGRLEMRILTAGDDAGCVSAPLAVGGHVGSIRHIMFTPDGATAITYAWDRSSLVRDFVSGRPLLREHRMVLQDIDSTGDRVRVWREGPTEESVVTLIQRTGYRTAAWAGEPRAAYGVGFSPDGRLGAVTYEHAIQQVEADCVLWDFARGVEIARVKGVWAQFSADSRTLFTFERPENRVRRYDVSQETLANRPALWSEGEVVYRGGRGEQINTGAMAPDGRTLVIAATEAVIFLDTHGQRPTRSWQKFAHAVVLSNDGKWMATRLHGHCSALQAADTGEAKMRLPRNSSVEFSPDSRWMAVATEKDLTVYELKSLDPESPRPVCASIVLELGASGVPPMAFSQDSRMIAVPYNRTHVRLYDILTGRELATLSPPNPAQIVGGEAVKFSPDGQWLVAAKYDGETVAWNIPVMRAELAKLSLDWEDGPPQVKAQAAAE